MTDHRSALIMFSGGQDSTACLAWALARFDRVETVGFDYGQRHRVELDCRQRILTRIGELNGDWRARLGPDRMVDASVLNEVSDTALTQEKAIEMTAQGLPSTFVPGRNILFFTLAAAVAYRRGITDLVGGMCETDYSGYPDCRDSTIRAMEHTLRLGLETGFVLHTPLMHLTKAQTWALTRGLGGQALVDFVIEETHTCYLGERGVRHVWGYGCGACPACALRAQGYETYAANPVTADAG